MASLWKGVIMALLDSIIGFCETVNSAKELVRETVGMNFDEEVLNVRYIPKFVPIMVKLGKLAEHSGLTIDNNIVLEWDAHGKPATVSYRKFATNLSGLLQQSMVYVPYAETSGKILHVPRTVAAKNIKLALNDRKKNPEDYALLANNCHMFTAQCITGKKSKTFISSTILSMMLRDVFEQSFVWKAVDIRTLH